MVVKKFVAAYILNPSGETACAVGWVAFGHASCLLTTPFSFYFLFASVFIAKRLKKMLK